jgi:murein DD-endopeptidase MepM/ murein hydrolase activator NlpD
MNKWPISVISSKFGPRKPIITPLGETTDFHNGIDIVASVWTPILPWRHGVVEWVSDKGGLGNHILIRHDNNYHSLYAHLHQLTSWEVGDRIPGSKSDWVGYVGESGKALGAHLHFEIWHYRRAIDPLPFFEGFV